ARRAEVRIFVDWFNRAWKRAPNEIADHGATDALAVDMRRAVELFEALLNGRDYLFGEFGLADVTAFPFLKYASFGLPPDDDELLDDYYPAPGTGFVVCDKEARILAVGRGVYELTGWGENDLLGADLVDSLGLAGFEEEKNPAKLALEWGVRRLNERLQLRAR